MSAVEHVRMVSEQEPADPVHAFVDAFRGAVAARRRMRSREPRGEGALSDAQYSLLFWLRRKQCMAAGELAVQADLSPASTTEMLESLERGGLVERARSLEDRRVVLNRLTARGEALVEERRAAFDPRLRAALAGFDDRELLRAAEALNALQALFSAPQE